MKKSILPCAFSDFLMEFNELIETMPPVNEVKKKLLDIKERAKINHKLSHRQREAIIARVDNFIAGQYGKTKRPEHFEHGKPSKNNVPVK